VRKEFVTPWSETVPWRDVELVHMNALAARGYKSAYMLKWWGCFGHFGTVAFDGLIKQRSTDRSVLYRDRGYYGLRPEATWATRPSDV